MIPYTIKLTKTKVDELNAIINKGSHTSQTFRIAYVLLNCDEGDFSEKVTNEQISKILKVGMHTIDRVKKKFIEEGFEAVLERCPTRVFMKRKWMAMLKQSWLRCVVASRRKGLQNGRCVCLQISW